MASRQSIKQRVLTCLTKLSDRDTQTQGAMELECIARTLDTNSLPVFLSCIHATDVDSDKSPVRRQCVRLVATLSEAHGNTLSPFLFKIMASIVRRLRDPDSSVRTSCADSVTALSAHVTDQPFSSFLRPLSEALFTEQDGNSQAGAAFCLASAIRGAPDPDPARLAKQLLPRLEKLLKCEGFKAKAAVLVLVGAVVDAGGASGRGGALRNLVPCLVESLGSDDWAARKGAAEALLKLAVVERDFLSEFKAGCLKVFQNRRYDKVKLVREVMNRMMEAWKQIPDVSDEFSPPPQSQSSSKENASDGRYPLVSQNSCSPASVMSKLRKKSSPNSRLTLPARSTSGIGKKKSAVSGTNGMSSGVLRKLNHKNWDVQIAVSNDAPFKATADQGGLQQRDQETVLERSKKGKSRFLKSETKRVLFDKIPDDSEIHKFGGSKAGSRVVPCSEESQDSVPVCNVTKDLHRNDKESADLSLIRNQLLQIEKQQSSLLDLLQKFIGSSENGMRSLETRVHGLEVALDEISYDLAVSSGRMTTKFDAHRNTCCLLPGAEFLSSKFRKKRQGRYSSSRFSRFGGTPSLTASHYRANRNAETKFTSHRFRVHGDGGLITNPLAEINTTNSREISGFARSEPD